VTRRHAPAIPVGLTFDPLPDDELDNDGMSGRILRTDRFVNDVATPLPLDG
jgi:hypothetical protein